MKFSRLSLDEAEGAILAHSHRLGDRVFCKGRRLSGDDIELLRQSDIPEVTCAQLESNDFHEDEAAEEVASVLAGDGLMKSEAFTGRCNLYAEFSGLVTYEAEHLHAVNLQDEAITIAALPPDQPVARRQMVATVKIIPYGVDKGTVKQAIHSASTQKTALRVSPFRPNNVGLIQTCLSGTKDKVLDRTRDAIINRLTPCGSQLMAELRCAHEEQAIGESIQTLVKQGCDLVLISGASATTDRGDVLPLGIEQAGGVIEQLGMPVDPGNLLILGRLANNLAVLGLPGCARSPATNGFDLVLHRLLADLPVTWRDIRRMGVGGLLKGLPGYRSFRTDIERPRSNKTNKTSVFPQAPKIGAIVLAAGSSRRMPDQNKLLLPVDDEPMVRRVVKQVLASQAEPVVVVLGNEADTVRNVLSDLGGIILVENPSYEEGMSGSLRHGLGALPASAEGAIICLGDMPWVTEQDMNRLIAAYSDDDGRHVCVPVWQGQRGNPVLWSRRFFDEMMQIKGDKGARELILQHRDVVCEVSMSSQGILKDIDEPSQVP